MGRMGKNVPKGNSTVRTVHLPDGMIDMIDLLIQANIVLDRSNYIRNSVKNQLTVDLQIFLKYSKDEVFFMMKKYAEEEKNNRNL